MEIWWQSLQRDYVETGIAQFAETALKQNSFAWFEVETKLALRNHFSPWESRIKVFGFDVPSRHKWKWDLETMMEIIRA